MCKETRRARIERLYQEELEFREAMQPFHKAEMREALLLFGLGVLMAAAGMVMVVLLTRAI